jgi:hypothetical protein
MAQSFRGCANGQSRRPFVQLDNGDRALHGHGSSLGLAIRDSSSAKPTNASLSRDVGGGQIITRRVKPTTVAIGALLLRNIPTDMISGAEADAPVLIGLGALRLSGSHLILFITD